MNRVRAITAPLILLLALSACANRSMTRGVTDNDLLTVSTALRDTAHTVGVLQSAVIEANWNGLIPEDVTHQIILVSVVVNKAGLDATEITRNVNALSPTDRTDILAILNPVFGALADMDSALVSEIREPGTQAKVRDILSVIRASLNTAQLALALR